MLKIESYFPKTSLPRPKEKDCLPRELPQEVDSFERSSIVLNLLTRTEIDVNIRIRLEYGWIRSDIHIN